MDRRQFLTASATTALAGATALSADPAWAWPTGCIDHLPKIDQPRIAWTVDDGFSQPALSAYAKLLENNEDLRMTFFVVRSASAWKQLAKPITELAATGRLQLANHTSTHINLVKASKAKIKQELLDCDKFIKQTFNYDPGTYFRPPYGYIDHRVIKIAKEVGYTTPTLWFGSTGAGSVKNSAQDWALCKKWMTNGRIIIDHANSAVTVQNFDRILKLLKSRNLETVTLLDAFAK